MREWFLDFLCFDCFCFCLDCLLPFFLSTVLLFLNRLQLRLPPTATIGAGGDATLGGAGADATLGDATLGDATLGGAGLPKIIPILICLSKISLVGYFSPLHNFV